MENKNYLLLISIFFMFSCQKINENDKCYDPNAVNEEALCTQQYDPVCGCDNKTYGNECVAANSGILHWEKGEC